MDHTQDVGDREGAAFQVIILGGGGGPSENDTTGILVRSTATQWTKGSILTIDAGVHLSALEDIVKQHLPNAIKAEPPSSRRASGRFDRLPPVPTMSPAQSTRNHVRNKSSLSYFAPITEPRASRAPSPSNNGKDAAKQNYVLKTGPFTDLMVPYESPSAIAAYMMRNLISAIMITHPHLDHLSGFAINTAALGGSRKKIIAGLPKTIEAIRAHIFNDVIWPNMSDEDGGIGFVSYNRLVEGGHPALGDEDSSGYSEICDGLEVKGRTVSHGHCMKQHKHRGSGSLEPTSPTTGRRRSTKLGSWAGLPGTSHGPQSQYGDVQIFHAQSTPSPHRCVIDSSAFFIRDEDTGKEILVFGDVEPDDVSEEPRNFLVWADAAPKIARGALDAVFIECSYDDSQPDSMLFGHLTPRWLIHELAQLAGKVLAYEAGQPEEAIHTLITAPTPKEAIAAHVPIPITESEDTDCDHSVRKKRRTDRGTVSTDISTLNDKSPPRDKSKLRHLNTVKANGSSRPQFARGTSAVSPMSSPSVPNREAYFAKYDGQGLSLENDVPEIGNERSVRSSIELDSSVGRGVEISLSDSATRRPLEGLKVVIIHVKDPLKDDHDAREVILRQCKEHEAKEKLGCEFYTCRRGDSFWV